MSATTRHPPPPFAAPAVFNTYELVEHILLHLPLRPLLLSQRVNKTTRNVVARSLDVRKVLFLEPCSGRPIHQVQSSKTSGSHEVWALTGDDEPIMPLLNPFMYLNIELDDHILSQRYPNHPARMPWYAKELSFSRHNILSVKGFAIDPSFPLDWLDVEQNAIRPNGTLGAMLLSQPAPSQFRVCEASSNETHSTRDSTIGGIIDDAIRLHVQMGKHWPIDSWKVDGMRKFCRMGRTVDTVTGREMLEIMGGLMAGRATASLAELGVIGT